MFVLKGIVYLKMQKLDLEYNLLKCSLFCTFILNCDTEALNRERESRKVGPLMIRGFSFVGGGWFFDNIPLHWPDRERQRERE